MNDFLKKKKFSKETKALLEDTWFKSFRKMSKNLRNRIANSGSIPVDRKNVFCISGDFYLLSEEEG